MRTRLFYAVFLLVHTAWAASGLTYSTYLRKGFTPSAIVTDAVGNVYLAGSTIIDPVTSQTAAMVVKLDPTGAKYLYVRTIGGTASDAALGIAVDTSGNAYVTGTTSSADFPVTPGRQTGTLPAANETRAFLIKFDPQGEILFSEVLDNVSTAGLAVALTADGGILVSGESTSELAASPGAYSALNTVTVPVKNIWFFLMKLNATGSNMVFTATGIGGSALAVDAAGSIYMAGSAPYTDYPTTPGAYQTVLYPHFCFMECFASAGTNQYVTKVDPAASKLIYSTGVGSQNPSTNHGLAVDTAGNAYVTGLAYGGYNWTLAPTNAVFQAVPFLTKLDAAGANALYSIPIGGAGVVLGSQGDVFVGGTYNDTLITFPEGAPLPPLPLGVSGLPERCQVNEITTFSEGTISRLDASKGSVLSTVLVGGSNISAAGIALAGSSSVWLAGPTSQADTPITPGAITPAVSQAGPLAGAYLGELILR